MFVGSGGGGGGGSPAPQLPARADVVLGTATPFPDLMALSAEVAAIRVRREDGTLTENLLSGPVRVDFIGPGDEHALVARAEVEPVAYTGMEVDFVPLSYRALANDGTPVQVSSTSDTLVAPFPAVATLDEDEYVRLKVDLDLRDALGGDVSTGSVELVPEADAVAEKGIPMIPLAELKALVVSVPHPTQIIVRAYADDAQQVVVGDFELIPFGPAPLFLDPDGHTMVSSGFSSGLVEGQTLLDVQAQLCHQGTLRTHRVQIEDHAAGAGSVDMVRLEGVVTAVQANGFDLRLRQIEDGAHVAEPTLATFASAESIPVSFDAGTVFVADNAPADSDALLLGSTVTVRFCSFATEPFPACQVDVLDPEPRFVGIVTDPAGSPDTFVTNMIAHDPAVMGGRVQDGATAVTVENTGEFQLLCSGEPITSVVLFQGSEVFVEGSFSGTPDAPTLTATRTLVRPGFLDDAAVTGVTPADSTFFTAGGTLADSFGPDVTPGTQLVHVDPAATFSGVASADELFELLSGPEGSKIAIDVLGVGSGTNEIRALHVEIEDED
jgi:hypothetical protein